MQKKTAKDTKDLFPEHGFIRTCLGLGLTLYNLREITYVDVVKMFLSYTTDDNNTKPTQDDIDRIM